MIQTIYTVYFLLFHMYLTKLSICMKNSVEMELDFWIRLLCLTLKAKPRTFGFLHLICEHHVM